MKLFPISLLLLIFGFVMTQDFLFFAKGLKEGKKFCQDHTKSGNYGNHSKNEYIRCNDEINNPEGISHCFRDYGVAKIALVDKISTTAVCSKYNPNQEKYAENSIIDNKYPGKLTKPIIEEIFKMQDLTRNKLSDIFFRTNLTYKNIPFHFNLIMERTNTDLSYLVHSQHLTRCTNLLSKENNLKLGIYLFNFGCLNTMSQEPQVVFIRASEFQLASDSET